MRIKNTNVALVAGFALIGLVACGQNETPAPTVNTDVELPPVEGTDAAATEDDHDHDGAGEVHEHGKGELAISLDGATLSVAFEAPWGEAMFIKEGGVLVHGGGKDVYGIQPDEFDQTYTIDAEPT